MPQDTTTIFCQDDFGQLFPVPVEAIEERTAVYGILIEGQKILLHVHEETGLLQLPGGILDHNQSFDQGLRQYFRRATGADTVLQEIIFTSHTYQKTQRGGIKRVNLFFRLHRPLHNKQHFINFDNPLRPQWIGLRSLQRRDLHFGYDAIRAAAAFAA